MNTEGQNKAELWDYYQALVKDHGFDGITDLLAEHARLHSLVKNSIEAPDAIKLLQRVAASTTDSIPAPKPENCCSYWRNDAIENAATIADKYEQNYCAQDIRNMKRPTSAQQPQRESELRNCPNCGSGDVLFCEISVRPHCNDCKHWAPVNHGTKQEAVDKWNNVKQQPLAVAVPDNFNGDDRKLIECATALLELDAKGALVPHGVGGHARTIIESLVCRLSAQSPRITEQDAREILQRILDEGFTVLIYAEIKALLNKLNKANHAVDWTYTKPTKAGIYWLGTLLKSGQGYFKPNSIYEVIYCPLSEEIKIKYHGPSCIAGEGQTYKDSPIHQTWLKDVSDILSAGKTIFLTPDELEAVTANERDPEDD